jgi:hypothetical protein
MVQITIHFIPVFRNSASVYTRSLPEWGGGIFAVALTNNRSFIKNETQRKIKRIFWRFVWFCAGKNKLHFLVTDLNSLFVWAMRSVCFATYTNANNCAGEKALFISADSCYKSSYYSYLRNKNRSLSTQYIASTEWRNRVTLEWLQQEGSKCGGRDKQIIYLIHF